MCSNLSRRSFLQAAGALALAPALHRSAQRERRGPDEDGLPTLCLGIGRNADAEQMRRYRQIGIDHVLTGGPKIPWTEADLQNLLDRFRAGGLTVVNLMISGFPNVIYGRPGRDEEIEQVQRSIRAAGSLGVPVVEYNFYAHRLMEGYYEEEGRGGAGLTAFTYEPVKDLPPPETGTHTAEALWEHLAYFLEAVVPVAETSGVRLAQHPNDPPVPTSRGSAQIMATLDDWKRLIELVDSPANGITYDCGVTREIGEDPVAVARYFGERDRINHVHYRNVIVREPALDYTEVFPDEGEVDLFAVMRELVRQGYSRALYPEHPRALDYDRERPDFWSYYPGGGGYAGEVYNVAYTRAMLQAARSAEQGAE